MERSQRCVVSGKSQMQKAGVLTEETGQDMYKVPLEGCTVGQ